MYEARRDRPLPKKSHDSSAASRDEIKTVVQNYLEGYNISEIAKSIYRSPSFVKNIVERVGVPQKLAESDYEGIRNSMLPEECVAESFEYNERVWFPKKNKFAIVKDEITPQYQVERRGYYGYGDITKATNYEEKYGAKCYKIFIQEPCDTSQTLFPWVDGDRTGFWGTALAYDMGSLKHLEEYL